VQLRDQYHSDYADQEALAYERDLLLPVLSSQREVDRLLGDLRGQIGLSSDEVVLVMTVNEGMLDFGRSCCCSIDLLLFY
jgi:hypothetical protein